jgi:hypothetical protein
MIVTQACIDTDGAPAGDVRALCSRAAACRGYGRIPVV